MLLCSVAHLVQRFRGEILFQLDQFEIHTGDKIGLIGANGCGKTTLLKLLARECEPDQGVIINPVPIRFFHQQPLPEEITPSLSRMSQGQQTATRLQAFFTRPTALAFLDEPTTHLDLPSRQTFEAQLATLDSFILVSHDQQLDLLNPDETILQNALRLSVQKEEVIRTVLSRMLFPQDTLNKKAAVLSSGERVRLALVCLFCSACNMLILDEPTHYLDLPSIQALTQLLQTAGQCVILISHDPALIRQTCTQLLRFENQKLISLAVEDWSTTRTSKPPLEKTILQMRLISLEEALRQQPENPALQDQRDALIVQLRQFI